MTLINRDPLAAAAPSVAVGSLVGVAARCALGRLAPRDALRTPCTL